MTPAVNQAGLQSGFETGSSNAIGVTIVCSAGLEYGGAVVLDYRNSVEAWQQISKYL